MTTDFRALCVELIASWDADGCDWKPQHQARWEATVARARAALGKDEPAVPEGREPASVAGQPSDEELLALVPQGSESDFCLPRGLPSDWVDGDFIAPPEAVVAFARAVLARYGHQPAPVAGEVAELVDRLRRASDGASAMGWEQDSWAIARAAELLHRLSPPQPVPVSERLPGPEDCDAEGRCWLFSKVEKEWRLLDAGNPGVPHLKYCFSHWLPAHALPIPQQQQENTNG